MMTAESMLSKRPVLRITVTLIFLIQLFSFHIYCIQIQKTFLYFRNFFPEFYGFALQEVSNDCHGTKF